MVNCQVLRCRNVGGHVIPIPASKGLRMEAAVCSEHKLQIDGGAGYRWHPNDPEDMSGGGIVMGADLDASGVTVTKFLGTFTHAMVMAHDGTPAITFQLDTRRSDGTLDTLRLVMPESVADQLALFFHMMWPHPAGDGGA